MGELRKTKDINLKLRGKDFVLEDWLVRAVGGRRNQETNTMAGTYNYTQENLKKLWLEISFPIIPRLCPLEASCSLSISNAYFPNFPSAMGGGINFDMPHIFTPGYTSTGGALHTHFSQIPKG